MPGTKISIPVTVYFTETPLKTAWQKTSWRLDGVLPAGSGDSAPGPDMIHESSDASQRTQRWHGLRTELDPRSCQAYYDNLSSTTPKTFVICHTCDQGHPQPFQVSFDISEAEAYMEADEQVYACRMDPQLYLAVEAFVIENYTPRAPAKRRRMP